MTAFATLGDTFEDTADMAGVAGQLGMLTGQHKTSMVVIEFLRLGIGGIRR